MVPSENPWDSKLSTKSIRARQFSSAAEVVALAIELGIETPQAEAPDISKESTFAFDLMRFVEANELLDELQVEAQEREDQAEVQNIIGARFNRRMEKKLNESTRLLESITASKEKLVQRLQQPYSGPSIPVELEQQPQFEQLLKHSAFDAGKLRKGVHDARWARDWNKPAAHWNRLQEPGPRALEACEAHFTGLRNLEDFMSQEVAKQ